MRLVLAFVFLFGLSPAWALDICPNVHFETDDDIRISDNEKRLLCGDPGSHAWQKIPPTQAQFFARTFLQSRGYLNPQFEIRENRLWVKVGPLQRVRDLLVKGGPKDFNPYQRRNLRGRALTPEILNEVENWAKSRIQELGYACVELKASADSLLGEITLDINEGPLTRFGPIQNLGLSTKSGIVDRQLAFLDRQIFDHRLLRLSTNRLVSQELYIGSYFEPRCDLPLGRLGELTIDRHLVSSTPRLVTFGVGVDSEVGPLFRSAFRHVLLTPNGSQGQITLTASLREQKLDARIQHYPSADAKERFYIEPLFELRREKEDQFESVTQKFAITPAWGLETETAQHKLYFGPAVEDVRVSESQTGPGRTRALFFTAGISSKSHLFEYYTAEPQEGWHFNLTNDSRLKGVTSNSSFHRLQIEIHKLWNLRNFDPPLLVIGSRTRLGTFLFEDQALGLTEIPVSQRFFLGGDSDLRGFSRKQLPVDSSGFVSAVTQGFELRFVEILPMNLQPLFLFDFGYGGSESLKLNPSLYYSPGVGLRWSSPLGPVRATIAQGRISQPQTTDENGTIIPETPIAVRWQVYFSFGREF